MKFTYLNKKLPFKSAVLINRFGGILFTILLVASLACKKKGASQSPAPAKATLVSPLANSTCTTGSNISGGQTKITLTWNAAANANSYEIKVKNLLTQRISTHNTSSNQIDVSLLQNTPYSWWVISKSGNNSSTATSDTWKFYAAGEATFSYAPFPADVVSPLNGQSLTASAGKVTLDWSASDVDNDIASYDVYLGATTANMTVVKTALTESVANDIPVNTGTTYYWKVLTKDSKGNVSWSDVWWFKAGL